MAQWRLVPLGLMAALVGSLLDSLLGATLCYTGYDAASGTLVAAPGKAASRISGPSRGSVLSGRAVDVLSAAVTAALTALAALRMFG